MAKKPVRAAAPTKKAPPPAAPAKKAPPPAAPAKKAPPPAAPATATAQKAPPKKRPAIQAGMSWITPSLVVTDADKAIEFYQKAFGFEKKMAMPGPDGRTLHGEVTHQGMVVMMGPEGAPGCPTMAPITTGTALPITLYVYCDDVDALYKRATAAGATGKSPPQDMFWGDRMCLLGDPDGYDWAFATNVADFDPSKVPH